MKIIYQSYYNWRVDVLSLTFALAASCSWLTFAVKTALDFTCIARNAW